MAKFRLGDIVSCRILASVLVGPYAEYDEVQSFAIIGKDDHGYYLFVPHYLFMKDTLIADRYRCHSLKISEKFVGEEMVYALESLLLGVERKLDGLLCRNCNELVAYAASNREDGGFVCFSCARNPWR